MNQRMSDPRAPLFGTHRLVEHWNRSAEGAITHQFGPAPIGYMSFDAAGHFSVHIVRTPAVPPFAHGPDKPRPEEALHLLESYYSAFGTYDVDPVDAVIVFRTQGSTRPDLVGAEGRFPFRIVDGKLVIGDDNTWRRVWERVT